jgi:hypothetical protein
MRACARLLRLAVAALTLILAGSCPRAAVEPRTLELKDVLGFSATEARAGDGLAVRLVGTCGHSALVVTQVEDVREGDAVNVRVRLSLPVAGRSGSFEHRVEVLRGVRTVTFGEARAVVWTAAAAKAPPRCVEASVGGPGDVVRALYAEYPFDGEKAVENEPREVIARYFDAKLAGLFIKEQECRKRYQGDLCNLTASLLYQAQDADIADLHVCASERGGEWIDVRFRNFGKEQVVTYRTAGTPAGWRIADQLFEGGGTLVKLLSQPL